MSKSDISPTPFDTDSYNPPLDGETEQPEHDTPFQAFPGNGAQPSQVPTKEYIEQLATIQLPDRLIDHLRIWLTQDWLLSKLTHASVYEAKWLARESTKRILSEFPRPNCPYPPEYMADVYNVPLDDCLEPLTARQRKHFIDLAELVHVRIARSEEGWQQDQMSKSLNVTRDETDREPEKKSRFWNLLG